MDGDGLAEERAALAALVASPLVKDVKQLNDGSGFYATLWRRSEHMSRKSEQRQYSRTRTKPAQCYRDLLELIEAKHGDHLAAAETARALAAAEAAAAACLSAPTTNAFAALGAAMHVQPAAEAAITAEKAAALARRTKQVAMQALAAASAAADAAEAEASQLVAIADDAREAAGFARKKARVDEQEADAEPTWRQWTFAKWHELETKEQARRNVLIDPKRDSIVAPKL